MTKKLAPTPSDRGEVLFDVNQKAEWMQQAACTGLTDLFYAEESDGDTTAVVAEAKNICNNYCPVKKECLDFAMATNEQFGVWGGTSPKDRRKLRKLTGKQIAPQTGLVWNPETENYEVRSSDEKPTPSLKLSSTSPSTERPSSSITPLAASSERSGLESIRRRQAVTETWLVRPKGT